MKILHFKFSIIFFLFIAFCFSGCVNNTTNIEDKSIKNTIVKFNYGLISAYYNLDPTSLRDVAGKEEMDKIGVIVSSFLEGNKVMESELIEIEFMEFIRQDDGFVIVETSEDWKYRWIEVGANQQAPDFEEINYRIFYKMSKKDDKWIVIKTGESLEDLYYVKKDHRRKDNIPEDIDEEPVPINVDKDSKPVY